METYFSDKLFNILIRHLVDEKKVLLSMVKAAEQNPEIRRELEMLMVEEVYKIRR